MDRDPPEEAGLLASTRRFGATLLEALGNRAELAMVEFREEADRRKEFVALAAAGAVFLALGLLLAALFVVACFWDTHRLTALGGVTVLYLAIAAVAFARLRARVEASPPPFEATLRELAADAALLRGKADE